MTIKIGDKLPDSKFMIPTIDGPKPATTQEIFGGKKVALFALPGAFTPTCSARHLPSYIEKLPELKAKGIDAIACTAVNDVFVMGAWAKDQGIKGEIIMLADGSANFAKAIGLDFDGSAFGMGIRSQRYGMVVDDGIVTHLFVEKGGEYKVSAAEYMLENI
ncbi:MAG: AhpC/TSA family protein [Hyphomonadaceae bacterium]|nr:MAG: AhpC/TSA family protein [Hyphomonadaceae bacterium]KAF0185032.1 MAG: AhpC/TSA family protein [Hyphomonadaceae bacterium]